ncbi:TPM domain-containing protein [Treponema phagedenis]|uniref:TPM domain-containing protein n=1 Tax=Treponema phagedenis TaxID=162 RepID=UPI0001F63ABD|nr:TPM domain-containing protein [Treponema phagedenis]EFW38834.1 hypothetical protein HMPREF9554_00655 [Treponema phagedenis F0421]TYT78242.1 TPM domain-containing protein [Treponema phagedenis]
MKELKFIKKIGIESKDFTAIKEAVKKAEKNTDGEIALAVIKESDDYSKYELVSGLIVAAAAFLALLPFSDSINCFLNTTFWYPATWYLPAFVGLIAAVVTGIFFIIANIPVVDRFIIPKREKNERVYTRALRHFMESGIYKTKNRAGILIFISVMERKVFVLADEGINAKIEHGEWQSVCNKICDGIKQKQAGKVLCEAVADCGEKLAKYFPAKNINPNELPDGLVVL